MDRSQSNRPDKVGQAVMLIYVTLGIGVLRSIIETTRLAESAPLGFVLFITLSVFGTMWFFIHMIGKGRNWARITFLVMFIIGTPLSVQPLLQSLSANPISGLLGIAQTGLQLLALTFLFQKRSSDWFREMKSLKQPA